MSFFKRDNTDNDIIKRLAEMDYSNTYEPHRDIADISDEVLNTIARSNQTFDYMGQDIKSRENLSMLVVDKLEQYTIYGGKAISMAKGICQYLYSLDKDLISEWLEETLNYEPTPAKVRVHLSELKTDRLLQHTKAKIVARKELEKRKNHKKTVYREGYDSDGSRDWSNGASKADNKIISCALIKYHYELINLKQLNDDLKPMLERYPHIDRAEIESEIYIKPNPNKDGFKNNWSGIAVK